MHFTRSLGTTSQFKGSSKVGSVSQAERGTFTFQLAAQNKVRRPKKQNNQHVKKASQLSKTIDRQVGRNQSSSLKMWHSPAWLTGTAAAAGDGEQTQNGRRFPSPRPKAGGSSVQNGQHFYSGEIQQCLSVV